MGRNSQHPANNLPPRPPPNAGKPNGNNGAGNCNSMPNTQSTTTLQMKQTQQLHINQHGPNSPGIHVRCAFHNSYRNKIQMQCTPIHSLIHLFIHSYARLQVSAGQHMHLSGDMKSNVSVAAQQGIFFNQQHANKAQPPPNMNAGPGCNNNASNMNNNQQPHAQQPNNNPQSKCTPLLAKCSFENKQTNEQKTHFCFTDSANDSYSVSQTQTINFTQQNLRQRQAQQPPNQQAQQSQSQQHSQMGMQMNMAQQNPGKQSAHLCKCKSIDVSRQ